MSTVQQPIDNILGMMRTGLCANIVPSLRLELTTISFSTGMTELHAALGGLSCRVKLRRLFTVAQPSAVLDTVDLKVTVVNSGDFVLACCIKQQCAEAAHHPVSLLLECWNKAVALRIIPIADISPFADSVTDSGSQSAQSS